jgi:hypothetical protein
MTSIARIERFVVQSMLGLVTPSFNAVSFFMSPGGVLHLFVALSELAPHDQAAIDDIVGYLDASLQPPMPMEVHTWVGDWDRSSEWPGISHHLVLSVASPSQLAVLQDPMNR